MNSKNWHFPEALARGEFPYLTLLGIEVSSISEGHAEIKMTVTERHLRSLGILHGGVTSSLIDTALGLAGASHAPDNHHAVTSQLSVNFTRIAKAGETLTTKGETIHMGSRTAVCRGEVRNEQGDLIASGTSTVMFLPLENP